MPSTTPDWINAISSIITAGVAILAFSLAFKEIELRRLERRGAAWDSVAKEIIALASKSKVEFTNGIMAIKSSLYIHLGNYDPRRFPASSDDSCRKIFSAAEGLYQDLRAALILGQANWGNKYEGPEKELLDSRFYLLSRVWALQNERDREGRTFLEAGQITEQFLEPLTQAELGFVSALDSLVKEVRENLHGAYKQHDPFLL